MSVSDRDRAPGCARRWARRRVLGTPLASLAVGLAALLAAGCAAAGGGAAGAGAVLYVVNGLDATITRVDAASGRVTGGPLPAGPVPRRMVPGPAGSLLILSASKQHADYLTQVFRVPGGWATRAIAVRKRTGETLLAGDGGRFAVAAHPAGVAADRLTPPCVLAVLDLVAGGEGPVHRVCTAHDSLFSLALGRGPAGLVAYLGLWRRPAGADGGHAPGHGVLVAVPVATGAVAAWTIAEGVPEQLVLAAAPGGLGQRLYAVEGTPGPEVRNPGLPDDRPRWRLLGLHPATLEVESAFPLAEEPRALAVAPDGNDAYALVAGQRALRSAILRLDLATGSASHLLALPGESLGGLAIAGDRLYAPHTLGSAVWAVDRRRGRLLRTIPVGRGPIGLALGQ